MFTALFSFLPARPQTSAFRQKKGAASAERYRHHKQHTDQIQPRPSLFPIICVFSCQRNVSLELQLQIGFALVDVKYEPLEKQNGQ